MVHFKSCKKLPASRKFYFDVLFLLSDYRGWMAGKCSCNYMPSVVSSFRVQGRGCGTWKPTLKDSGPPAVISQQRAMPGPSISGLGGFIQICTVSPKTGQVTRPEYKKRIMLVVNSIFSQIKNATKLTFLLCRFLFKTGHSTSLFCYYLQKRVKKQTELDSYL